MQTCLHATSVSLEDRGLLICGASGKGKSSLALELMSRGAVLVSDDQTLVTREGDELWLDAPVAIRGRIEARGVGILHAQHSRARLAAVLDLDHVETARLPPFRQKVLLGCSVPLLHKCTTPYFPAALAQYLSHGRES